MTELLILCVPVAALWFILKNLEYLQPAEYTFSLLLFSDCFAIAYILAYIAKEFNQTVFMYAAIIGIFLIIHFLLLSQCFISFLKMSDKWDEIESKIDKLAQHPHIFYGQKKNLCESDGNIKSPKSENSAAGVEIQYPVNKSEIRDNPDYDPSLCCQESTAQNQGIDKRLLYVLFTVLTALLWGLIITIIIRNI